MMKIAEAPPCECPQLSSIHTPGTAALYVPLLQQPLLQGESALQEGGVPHTQPVSCLYPGGGLQNYFSSSLFLYVL